MTGSRQVVAFCKNRIRGRGSWCGTFAERLGRTGTFRWARRCSLMWSSSFVDDGKSAAGEKAVNLQTKFLASAPFGNRGIGTAMAKAVAHVLLIKPCHYDDQGYPLQWHRSMIPSNSLASVHGLAEAFVARGGLGP